MADITATQRSVRSRDDWETPDALYRMISDHFGPFTLDPAASAENAKCPVYYTQEQNGLVQPWSGRVYVNPPYSKVAAWMHKAWQEASEHRADVTMLVAARPDTAYWWEYARHAKVVFLRGRVRFVGAAYDAPFPSAIVHFEKGMGRTPSTSYWYLRRDQRR